MTVLQLHPRPPAPTTSAAAAALESNLGLLRKAVKSVRMPEEFREDAFQEAAVAFLRHFDAYDPDRGKLTTFMWPHLRGAVLHFVRDQARRPMYTDDERTLDLRVDSTFTDVVDIDVERFLASVSADDRDLLLRIYWLDEPPSAIARALGISRQSLHVRHQRLLTKARAHLFPLSRTA